MEMLIYSAVKAAARIIALLCIGLWLGGIAALFLFVSQLFQADREAAAIAAPVIFKSFASYQLVIAGIGLISTLWWRRWPLLSIVALCAVAAAVTAFYVIPQMEAIRAAGEAGSSTRFKRLHGASMMIFASQAALLLIAHIIAIVTLRREGARTAGAASPAREFPV